MIWLVASMLTLPLAPKSTSTRCAASSPSEVPGPSTLPRSPRLSLVPASSMSQTQAAPMVQPRAWTCAAEEQWCGRISRRSREIDGDHAVRRQGDGDAHAHDRYRRSWQDKACACACAWAILRYLEITRVDATVGEGRSRRDLGRSRVDQTRSLRGRTCGQGWGRGRGSVQILEVRFWCQE